MAALGSAVFECAEEAKPSFGDGARIIMVMGGSCIGVLCIAVSIESRVFSFGGSKPVLRCW